MTARRDSTSHPVGRQAISTYLLLGLVFGVLWFGLLAALYVSGLAAQFALLSLPTVVWAQLLLRPIGRFERHLVRSLLGQDVPAPAPIRYERSTGSRMSGTVNVLRRAYASFQDGHSWRVLVWTFVRFFTGPLGFVLVVGRIVLPALLILAPLAVLVDAASERITIDVPGKHWLLLSPIGLLALGPLRRAIGALANLHRRLAVWALGPGRAEIEAAALARAARAEEQVRIDQELHDSIGHMLSMIVVQAGAGVHVFDKDPDFARRALSTIEQRGRAALGELDRIISNIQGNHTDGANPDDGTGSGAVAGRNAPVPGGADLPALVDGARDVGMDVTARISINDLPPALGRGVYRIVQEALTNAAKHAPDSAVTVDVAADDDAVAVAVVNEFHGGWTPGAPGRGIAFIHDRASLLGGTATVGSIGYGFTVAAVLPVVALPESATRQCALTPHCACAGCAIRRSVLG